MQSMQNWPCKCKAFAASCGSMVLCVMRRLADPSYRHAASGLWPLPAGAGYNCHTTLSDRAALLSPEA